MTATVIKSSNTVNQTVNSFPSANYTNNLQIVRKNSAKDGNKFEFYNDNALTFKVSGGSVTLPDGTIYRDEFVLPINNISNPIPHVFTLDVGVQIGYLSWQESDNTIQGFKIGSGATPNYTIGLPSDNLVNIAYLLALSPYFNQDISLFKTKQVQYLQGLLYGCSSFNKAFNFDLSNALDMNAVFYACTSYNQSTVLDVPQVQNITNILAFAENFNSYIKINAPQCLEAVGAFKGAKAFNQSVDDIYIPNAKIKYFFENAKSFNKDVTKLLSHKPKDLEGFFLGASSFNQQLNFDASNVESLAYFLNGAASFNQPLGHLDISKCLNFKGIFDNAFALKQDISAWCSKFNVNADIADITNAPNMSTEHYDKFLNALWLDVSVTRKTEWAASTSRRVIYSQFGKSSAASADAKIGLASLSWTIIDAGVV